MRRNHCSGSPTGFSTQQRTQHRLIAAADGGADVAYHVQCEVFEGPIDLLVSLAHRGEVDLSRVPLRQITEGYREQARIDGDLDHATDVLVHLAVLADLKARTLV